jgi:hypothetical protein
MEISVARKRLEEMRDDLDRTVMVLRGEHPLARGDAAEAGDAGAYLTEADRNQAAVQAVLRQRAEVAATGGAWTAGMRSPNHGWRRARPPSAACPASPSGTAAGAEPAGD